MTRATHEARHWVGRAVSDPRVWTKRPSATRSTRRSSVKTPSLAVSVSPATPPRSWGVAAEAPGRVGYAWECHGRRGSQKTRHRALAGGLPAPDGRRPRRRYRELPALDRGLPDRRGPHLPRLDVQLPEPDRGGDRRVPEGDRARSGVREPLQRRRRVPDAAGPARRGGLAASES